MIPYSEFYYGQITGNKLPHKILTSYDFIETNKKSYDDETTSEQRVMFDKNKTWYQDS